MKAPLKPGERASIRLKGKIVSSAAGCLEFQIDDTEQRFWIDMPDKRLKRLKPRPKPTLESRAKEERVSMDTLKHYCADLHWMARRYADGRSSYAPSMFNKITRALLKLGVKLNPTGDSIIWARDGMGRIFDRLSEAEATPGTPEAIGLEPQP